MDYVLREGFQLAHRRIVVVFLDLLWKAIWCALTLGALALAAVWFASEFRSIAWVDSGNRAVDTAIGLALVREFWGAHRIEIFLAAAAVLIFSLVVWFLLEAAFRARILSANSPPRRGGVARSAGMVSSGKYSADPTTPSAPFLEASPYRARASRAQTPLLCEEGNFAFSTFLLSNVFKCLFVAAAALALVTICFARYFVTPFSEWGQLWPDTRGAALIALVTLAAVAFLLTIIDTLVRSGAVELLGTDLFRVTGLIGILLLFEAMISGSCVLIVGIGFLNVAGWKDILVMLATGAVAVVFMTALHSYLLLVRFSAVAIMRQNVIEV